MLRRCAWIESTATADPNKSRSGQSSTTRVGCGWRGTSNKPASYRSSYRPPATFAGCRPRRPERAALTAALANRDAGTDFAAGRVLRAGAPERIARCLTDQHTDRVQLHIGAAADEAAEAGYVRVAAT